MTAFSQQTPLQRAQSHIDLIKKSSILMKRNPYLPLDKPDDHAWEPDAETTEAKRKAIENCDLAADDYAKNGHEDMAELYRLKAAMIGGSASATRDYFRKLDEVRNGKAGSSSAKTQQTTSAGTRVVLWIVSVLLGVFAFIMAIGAIMLFKQGGQGSVLGGLIFSVLTIVVGGASSNLMNKATSGK